MIDQKKKEKLMILIRYKIMLLNFITTLSIFVESVFVRHILIKLIIKFLFSSTEVVFRPQKFKFESRSK